MTRGVRRSIRALAVAAIFANVAILYTARPAQAALNCPAVVIACPLSGTCFLSQQDLLATCDAACQSTGGPTCRESPGIHIICEAKGCSSTEDELFCHCQT